MLKVFLPLLATGCLLASDPLVWTNDAELNGNPDTSFLSADNWDSDTVPTATDDVQLLSHSDPVNPVNLPSSSEVKSIISRVPFDIDDTLTVSAASIFENSIQSASSGRLRANGPITFEGNNFLQGMVLDGSSDFTNEGTILIGSRGVSANFTNKSSGEVIMTSGITRFSFFVNEGILNLGGSGSIDSSSILLNEGTVKKAITPQNPAAISGDYTQTGDAILEVATGHTLSLNGPVQSFLGGTIQADGTLNLAIGGSGTTNRKFDGISSISGDGTINQVAVYTLEKSTQVNLPNEPGFQIGNLFFGDSDNGTAATFINNGYLTFGGSELLASSITEEDGGNLFLNQPNATVEQTITSNPTFEIEVQNAGTWLANSMRLAKFTNNKTMTLLSGSERIQPLIGSSTGEFKNNGRVNFDESTTASSYDVTVKYDQPLGGSTTIREGSLILNGGSDTLSGLFEIEATGTLSLRLGDFDLSISEENPSGYLEMKGAGLAIIGDGNLNPNLQDSNRDSISDQSEIDNKLGLFEGGAINSEGGLRFRSGTLSPIVENTGLFIWNGGTIRGRLFTNKRALEIRPGSRPRVLEGAIFNEASASDPVIQSTSITISEFGNFNNEPGARHELFSGASISGDGDYENKGTLVCTSGTGATVSVPFTNDGTIEVQGTGQLNLPFLTNIGVSGEVIVGGTYIVGPSAKIIIPEIIRELFDADWSGPGTEHVVIINGRDARLHKTTSDTHNETLSVENGATLDLGAGTTTTAPTIEVKDFGIIKGSGGCDADVDLTDFGIIGPGSSPGTLAITGAATFSSSSTYEWEAASASSSDTITGDTVTLAGTLKVFLLDDYLPVNGQSFTIITGTSITGGFDFIDLSEIPAGYSVMPTYNPTSVTITFTENTPYSYDDWAAGRFTPAELLDLTISGTDGDPDKDRLKNIQEFGFGLNPKEFSKNPFELIATTPTSMDFRFTWADDSNATYRILTSNTVGSFSPAPTHVLSTTADVSPGIDEITIRSTHTESDTQFGVLEILTPD
ncbi:MAG: hypothetical protein AAGJ81_04085 [Verrucomicrobiota bacterium]